MSLSEKVEQLNLEISEAVEKALGELRQTLSDRLRMSSEELADKLKVLAPTLPARFVSPDALASEAEELRSTAARASREGAFSELREALAAVDRARSQADVLNALLEEGKRFAWRTMLLLNRGGELHGWGGRGWHEAPETSATSEKSAPGAGPAAVAHDAEALRGVVIQPPAESPWGGLVDGGGGARLSAAECAPLCSRLESPLPAEGLLLPLVLRDKVVAILYADRRPEGELAAEALQTLTYVSAQAIESLAFRERAATATLARLPEAERNGSAGASAAEPSRPSLPAAPTPPPNAASSSVAGTAAAATAAAIEPAVTERRGEPRRELEEGLPGSHERAGDRQQRTTEFPFRPTRAYPAAYDAAEALATPPAPALPPLEPLKPPQTAEPAGGEAAPEGPSEGDRWSGPATSGAAENQATPATSQTPPNGAGAEASPSEVSYWRDESVLGAIPRPAEAPEASTSAGGAPSPGGPEAQSSLTGSAAGSSHWVHEEALPAGPAHHPAHDGEQGPQASFSSSQPPERLPGAGSDAAGVSGSSPFLNEAGPESISGSRTEQMPLPAAHLSAVAGGASSVPSPGEAEPPARNETVLLPRGAFRDPLPSPAAAPAPLPSPFRTGSARPDESGVSGSLAAVGAGATPSGTFEPLRTSPLATGTPEVRPPSGVHGPGWAFATSRMPVSPTEEALHEEARRLARLLVSEIKLYNEEQVEAGRRNRDIYERLREDIDRSRQMYEERIEPKLAKSTDYFYQELVRILAAGDSKALGI